MSVIQTKPGATTFIRKFATRVTVEGKSFYFMPYYLEIIGDTNVVIHPLENLPENLKEALEKLKTETL